jgi:carbon storage regulator
MLVLRRRAGEAILIGDGIEIQVVDVSPSRVKLGITAPGHVAITRKEIKLTHDQNIAAAGEVSPASIAALVRKFRP